MITQAFGILLDGRGSCAHSPYCGKKWIWWATPTENMGSPHLFPPFQHRQIMSLTRSYVFVSKGSVLIQIR